MKVLVQGYLEDKKQAQQVQQAQQAAVSQADKDKTGDNKARVALFAKQFGLNLSQLTDEEIVVLDKVVKGGGAYKKGVARRGGRRG